MDVVIVLVVVAIVVAVLAAYIFLASRGARVTVPAAARAVPAANVPAPTLKPFADAAPFTRPVAEPAAPPLFDLDLDAPIVPQPDVPPPIVPQPPVEIRWSKQFDRRSGTLDETARLRLIGDLGVVAKEWCVPLLSQAYEEERRPGHRQAALIALAACRSRAATATFRLALASDDEAERAIAGDGLTDLEPPPQTKARRLVERHREERI